jgi:hypothetical protein
MSIGSITLDVIRKCLVVFKTFFQDLSGVTRENQEKALGYPAYRPRFEPDSSPIIGRSPFVR